MLAVVAALTAAIALAGALCRPPTASAAGGINLAPGISVTPAPGWTVGDRGRGWVSLHNAFSSAELEIRVKPAAGSDPVAALQSDIDQLSSVSTTGLTNVRDLSVPSPKPAHGNFNEGASIDYTADGTSRMGAIPVTGSFVELLNTSTRQSAFVVYAENGDAPPGADGEAQLMLDSLL
ncbi:hypothetical protein Mkiyose1665_59150 [Mycobacterium kiyosense]|uniref:Lipoprotein LpqN n=1 Tax=Mycobacterium kiyosense TaxID=2871094 RepID=A0A9P3QCP2_9MYCO|nr:hypothetical protein IWGMT90018_16130 [Mycobacterium kiyosense]BDE12959.1 hypothetical protein MKCMC460_18190 [Mycobacterium sp. 20KCMC460]GLB83604.1 hypothetical protein SRL2020028_28600 [Mycobacterium kiyosense]GLB93086.1 hypothetical protein SRL2020130_59030 [Mycobacterium kiyosense]GLC11307.1 hypothetical protein SRL2020411_59530 [Mycobacterium kiyosense]